MTPRPQHVTPAPRRGQRLALVASLLLALAASAPAANAAGPDADEPGGAYCSATARLLHAACGHERRDDASVGRAICVNLADAGQRASCLAKNRQQRNEAAQACQEQLDWRLSFCPLLGEDRYDPPFTPDLFDSDFRALSKPNPYFPLRIGHRWEYRGGDESNTVEILDMTKRIEGVTCVVLRDLVYVKGRLLEATDDWFAAGRDGSAWYCGEEVKDYASYRGDRPRQPELISTDGSFKHGRDGDKAGIIMPALPKAGQFYREEFSLGNAEDLSEVLSTNYAYGANDPELDRLVPKALAQRLCAGDCVVTRNYSMKEPNVYALKYYARGIGFFLETKPADGESLQLVDCNFDSRCVGLPTP